MRPDPWNVLKYMCMKYGYENYCYIELGTRSAVCGALTLLHLEVLAVCLIAWYGPANWGPPWSSSWGWWWWWRKGAPPKNKKLLKFSLLRLNFKTIFHFHWQRGTTEHCALLTCARCLGKKQLVIDRLETAKKTREFTFSIYWYIPFQFNIMRDALEEKMVIDLLETAQKTRKCIYAQHNDISQCILIQERLSLKTTKMVIDRLKTAQNTKTFRDFSAILSVLVFWCEDDLEDLSRMIGGDLSRIRRRWS